MLGLLRFTGKTHGGTQMDKINSLLTHMTVKQSYMQKRLYSRLLGFERIADFTKVTKVTPQSLKKAYNYYCLGNFRCKTTFKYFHLITLSSTQQQALM